jgi:hypothetical protein
MTLNASLCLLLLAGCNPIFDLDSTDVDTDSDGDGIFDAVDVCPALADDQRDDDRDGIGNACDVCPSDADPDQHDEDGDQRGDACDPCPTQQDFADSDTDDDGIGNACDPFSGGAAARRPSRRLLFDPFVTLAPEWQPRQSSTWTIDDDRVGPDAKLAADDGLAYPTLSLSANGHVDIVVFTKDHWEAGETFGIALVDDAGIERASCLVTCEMRNMCRMQSFVGTASGIPVTVPEHVVVPLRLVIDRALQHTDCTVDNSLLPTQVTAVPAASLKVVLIASPNAQIASVDVVEHGE